MATVYFVSHPLTGATRSRAAYRVAGTVLGATAAAVVTVPALVNIPIVLTGAIALVRSPGWSTLSLLERGPRSCVFLLAAYTLPIVALPAISHPGEIFDVAVARIEAIVIGIVCAGLVGAIVLPARWRPRCASAPRSGFAMPGPGRPTSSPPTARQRQPPPAGGETCSRWTR